MKLFGIHFKLKKFREYPWWQHAIGVGLIVGITIGHFYYFSGHKPIKWEDEYSMRVNSVKRDRGVSFINNEITINLAVNDSLNHSIASLYRNIEKGDSIYKPPNSDRIYLVKPDNTIYIYKHVTFYNTD